MHFVYVIRSLKDGSYYVGESRDYIARLEFHNDREKNTNVTKSRIPWELYWYLEVKEKALAFKIESHIKKMKSRKYIENLKRYKEISEKLIARYGVPGSSR